jgi:hypothetical protein
VHAVLHVNAWIAVVRRQAGPRVVTHAHAACVLVTTAIRARTQMPLKRQAAMLRALQVAARKIPKRRLRKTCQRVPLVAAPNKGVCGESS